MLLTLKLPPFFEANACSILSWKRRFLIPQRMNIVLKRKRFIFSLNAPSSFPVTFCFWNIALRIWRPSNDRTCEDGPPLSMHIATHFLFLTSRFISEFTTFSWDTFLSVQSDHLLNSLLVTVITVFCLAKSGIGLNDNVPLTFTIDQRPWNSLSPVILQIKYRFASTSLQFGCLSFSEYFNKPKPWDWKLKIFHFHLQLVLHNRRKTAAARQMRTTTLMAALIRRLAIRTIDRSTNCRWNRDRRMYSAIWNQIHSTRISVQPGRKSFSESSKKKKLF